MVGADKVVVLVSSSHSMLPSRANGYYDECISQRCDGLELLALLAESS